MSLLNPLYIPEILHVILNSRSILEPDDLAAASLVCKLWTNVSRRALWRDVELNQDSWIDPYYKTLLSQLSRYGSFVKNLTLKDCGTDRSRFEALLPFMTNLQTILVDRIMLHSNSTLTLRSLELLSFSQLRYLRLPHVSSTSGGTDLTLQICASANGIQHLELMDSDIDDDALLFIAEACPKLRSLDLSRNEAVSFCEIIRIDQNAHGNEQTSMKNDMKVLMSDSEENVTETASMSTTTTTTTTKNMNAVSIPTSFVQNSPYSIFTSTIQRDATNTEYFSKLSHQCQQSKQTQLQTVHAHLPPFSCCDVKSDFYTQILPKPALLQMPRPFMHLEELSLVFCLGITNNEFQMLFRSFEGKCLRSLNLQFTNIEDSGLETLAKVLTLSPMSTSKSDSYAGLTSVNVSYCNRITARGIKALVEGCPQLLELEFLSCDQVSADCFRGPSPWACTKLRSLEFTFHPRALFTKGRWRGEEIEADQQIVVMDESPIQVLDENQDLHQNNQHVAQQGTSEHMDTEEDRSHEKESVRDDYYAMFRQLKRLSQIQSLHIYNSPGLSNCANSFSSIETRIPDGDSSVTMAEPSSSPESVPAPLSSQPHTSLLQGYAMDDAEGSSSSTATNGNSSGGGVTEAAFRPNPEFSSRDTQPTPTGNDSEANTSIHQSRSNRKSVSLPTLLDSTPLPKQNPEHMTLHPFSNNMGFKALGRLKNLQTLTLYERSSVTLGQSEVRWIGKTFPRLTLLQLRGAIESPDRAIAQLKAKRPKIQVQVCPLFE
ncbi:hypothetical protein BGZ49_005281 [Haplosporangium sp. Z 27]|nr:hypothetical protein BGZ49_005281 [Haplosporangium sp. Z 27]